MRLATIGLCYSPSSPYLPRITRLSGVNDGCNKSQRMREHEARHSV